jgi:hypothetical protein
MKIRWSRQLGFHVPELTRVVCSRPEEAIRQFYRGVQHKTMGSHRLNATSSRSHAIFTVYLRRVKGGGGGGGRADAGRASVEDDADDFDDHNGDNGDDGDDDGDTDGRRRSGGNNNGKGEQVFENRLNDLGLETLSRLNLVDLAGSERLKQTGTTGRAKVESIQINKSLFVLRKVRACVRACVSE